MFEHHLDDSKEYQAEDDAKLSAGEPSSEYKQYIDCRATSFQRLAAQFKSDRPLHQVPRRQPAQVLAGEESSPSHKSAASYAHTVVVECCCGEQSRISSAEQRKGMTTLRLTKSTHDLSTSAGLRNAKREILGLVADKHQIHLWVSLPCKLWSRWNECNR